MEYQRALQQQQQQQQQQQITENKQDDVDEHEESQIANNQNDDSSKEEMMKSKMNAATEKLKQLSSLIESASKDELIKVALRLPDGKRVQHTFCNQNKVESLFDFANTFDLKVDDEYIEEFELVCSYPKRIFTKDDNDLTLKSIGIEHSMLLFVQSID